MKEKRMKYDIIIIGGGPAGLIAARTAARDGLKVVLVERRRNIAEINRACTQIFYLSKMTPVGDAETGQRRKDGYLEPVSVEVTAKGSKFHFSGPGFSVAFSGCLRPYLNWIQISPSGHRIHRYKVNERVWGYYFQKEVLMADLLSEIKKAGAEVMPESVQRAARFLPLTHVVTLVKGLWFGASWGDHLTEVAVLVGILIVGAVVAARVFRWE